MAQSKLEPLPRSFYRPSASKVAVDLLGHWLIRKTAAGTLGGPIVETEAYLCDDPACHGAPGLTARNQVMFGEPGRAYVYLIYGLHYCVNAVCCPPKVAEAVLIRAIEPLFGESMMRHNRSARTAPELTNGPAKVCQALAIERSLDGVDLCDPGSPLFIAKNPRLSEEMEKLGPVVTTARIGITRAANLPLRFYCARSLFLSRRPTTK